mgnify:CR=1 FL=1
MIRAIFFDLFGTLAHPAVSREELIAQACRQLGYPVEAEALLKPLADIKSPEIGMSQMVDLKGTLNLLRQTGVIP